MPPGIYGSGFDRKVVQAQRAAAAVAVRIFATQSDAMTPMVIRSHLLVDEVMRRAPATIRVFLDFKMGCVGCPIACFHDIDDACREHHVDRDRLLAALTAAAA
jgi:hybrid cluster-associated redox disulfide protein